MKTNHIALALSLLIAGLFGCAVERQQTPKTLLSLAVPPPTERQISMPGCLHARAIRPAAPYSDAALWYRVGQNAFEKDYQRRFLASPDNQLHQPLIEYLKSAGMVFCGGIKDQTGQRFTVEPHLLAFYTDFTDKQKPFAFVQMRFVLLGYDPTCRCGKMIWDKTFQTTFPLPAKPNGEQIAHALSAAAGEVFDKLLDALAQTDWGSVK